MRWSRRSSRSAWLAGERAALCHVGAVYPRDLRGRDDVFVMVAPGEHHECRECADKAQGDHPPDVPDQGEAHYGSEERANESGRRIARHFDGLVMRFVLLEALLFGARLNGPVRLLSVHIGQEGEIEN